MSPGSHASPSEPGPDAPRRRPGWLRRAGGSGGSPWRWGTPTVLLLSGGLFVTSAISSAGTDLRPGRYQDLSAIVAAEGAQAESLTDRVARLDEEVAGLSENLGDADVDDLQDQVEELSATAGLTEVSGEGLTITLSDSPAEVREASDRNQNLFVVHQQDIQVIVNALWAGGAEAVTIQGQRVVTTTGIKCQGNVIFLQGLPYPQPYEISAIGDADALQDAIDADRRIGTYREQAADPEIAIGWDLDEEPALTAPAYRGLLDLQYAEPMGS
ncbi:DUF881 domain-containing protein [Nocardioides zeae]|uniref:DUF881 domain-containing protein n=1 Tax=Nocardioides imazamoxiresistens TaxID=3231893 RepID=A0ABU3PW31_9ACTN|nr:DUF881 domain-containing protein [Nocardioides zeae]MDT9593037.1 DUF881 domain-containing protein [Nocardioides zeae]